MKESGITGGAVMNESTNSSAVTTLKPVLSMPQIRTRLESLHRSLMVHRAALAVCYGALANDDEVIAPDVAKVLDVYILSQLSEEIENIEEFIARLPDHPDLREEAHA